MEDLEEIDEIMDGIMGDQASDVDQIDPSSNVKSPQTQSPTQPALLSQKQQILDEAVQEASNQNEIKQAKCSIEDMLGERDTEQEREVVPPYDAGGKVNKN